MKKFLYLCFLILIVFAYSCKQNIKNYNLTSILDSKDSVHIKISKISELIKESPENASLLNSRAKLYFEKQSYDSAFTDIRKAILLDSSKSEYFCTLSDIYLVNGNVDKSGQALNKAIILNPDNNDAYLKMAELYFIMDNINKCFEYLHKAVHKQKQNPKAYFLQGLAFKQMGDTTKAITAMQTAVEQDPDYYDAFIQLGLMFASKHDKLAIEYYNNALNIKPQSTEALYNLGMFYQENDMINDALKAYNIILKISPQHKNALYNIGYINLVFLDSYHTAIKYFSDAINIDAKYTEAYYNRGLCYEMLGDYKNAAADYNQAMRIIPNYDKSIEGLNRIDNKLK